MYFYRPTEGGITDLALDPDGTIPGYKCQNGIAYETRNTPQVDGRSASGDGTVPYASMAYCKKWKNSDSIEVTVTELDKCDHRDILKDSRFVDYVRPSSDRSIDRLARWLEVNLTSLSPAVDGRIPMHTNHVVEYS